MQEKHLKKAANQKARRVSQSANSYTNLRDELNQKYEELRMWQKKSVKALNKVAIEASYRAYMDECMSVEQQIQNSLRELKD